LQLVLLYGYAPERIDFEVNMPGHTPNYWADIIVYSDDAKVSPYVVVECKKPDVTDAEFQQAILQGFGNANSIRAAYLWVTSGTLSRYFDVANFPSGEREKNIIPDIPKFGTREIPKAKFYKGGVTEKAVTEMP
jgi:type I restriction enzyme M protein